MHERPGETVIPKVQNVPRSVFPQEQKASVNLHQQNVPLDEKDEVEVIVVKIRGSPSQTQPAKSTRGKVGNS